ncbi:MAG: type II toxin-antitoxin system VapC family toxin [Ilumatobacteraceae bacterium]
MGLALKLLLDTSTLIWITVEPGQVSSAARAELDSAGNELWVSAASAWEIATKHRLGRLEHAGPLVTGWSEQLERFSFDCLPVTDRHALRAGSYEIDHADPFDRMIAAQAELEQMTVVAIDRAFDLFPVRRLW